MEEEFLVNSPSTVSLNDYKTCTDLFEDVFPFYLANGMTYDQFWHGCCNDVIAYRKAHDLKLEQANTMNWMLGLYFYKALVVVANNVTNKDEKLDYFDRPIPITEKDIEEQREREKEKEIVQAEAWMEGFFAKHQNIK